MNCKIRAIEPRKGRDIASGIKENNNGVIKTELDQIMGTSTHYPDGEKALKIEDFFQGFSDNIQQYGEFNAKKGYIVIHLDKLVNIEQFKAYQKYMSERNEYELRPLKITRDRVKGMMRTLRLCVNMSADHPTS